MDALILIGSLIVLLLIGFPVAFAVGLSAFIGAWWIDLPLEAVVIQITNGVNEFSLLTILFFILAGAIMAEGGIARRLMNFAYIFVGFIRGGLSLVNIVASTFFGAISGSSVADTASIIITDAFTSLSDNKYVILMCIKLLLVIGTLMDMAPIILILTPVLLPVATALGIDPVHFGMIMMTNLGIGLITPPVGTVLFVLSPAR